MPPSSSAWRPLWPRRATAAPVVAAGDVVWALLAGYLLRDGAFHAVEGLVRSRARRALGLAAGFSDDTLAYVTERLDPACTRAAVVTAVRHAKRHKAFDHVWLIGVVFDGTTVTRCPGAACRFCHPVLVPHTPAAPHAGGAREPPSPDVLPPRLGLASCPAPHGTRCPRTIPTTSVARRRTPPARVHDPCHDRLPKELDARYALLTQAPHRHRLRAVTTHNSRLRVAPSREHSFKGAAL